MPSHTTSHALAPGIKLGSYVIQKILGANMHAFTYLAFDRELKRDVIIKENFPMEAAYRDSTTLAVLPRHPRQEEEFRDHLDRFMEQSRLFSTLDHPGIVPTQNIYEALGTGYSVMSFIPGNSLETEAEKRHNANRPWTAKEVSRLFEQILQTFEYLHSKKILHGSIRPDHFILTPAGQPVLIGIGMNFPKTDEKEVTIIVSPDCAPPEQMLNNAHYDAKSEIYALGATFHKLLLGAYPERSDLRFYSNRSTGLAENTALTEKFPVAFLGGIDRALDPVRENRFSTVGEWLAFMENNRPPATAPKGEEDTSLQQNEESQAHKTDSQKRSPIDEEEEDEYENNSSKRRQKRTRQRKGLLQNIKEFFLKKEEEDEY